MQPVTYVEKGYGLHVAVRAAGHTLREESGEWFADDAAAVQALIDAYDPLAEARADAYGRLAEYRWKVETGGIVVAGVPVQTDDRSKLMLMAATQRAQPVQWKTEQGFVELSPEQLIALSAAVAEHVQTCFDKEAAIRAQIDAISDWQDAQAFDVAAAWAQ